MSIDKASVKVNGKEVWVSVDEHNIATIKCEKGDIVEVDFSTETAISNVKSESENANSPIYDLSGRRINKLSAGQLYIQNGKKVVND